MSTRHDYYEPELICRGRLQNAPTEATAGDLQPDSSEPTKKTLELEVKKDYQGRRLDKYLATRLTQYSRSFLQKLIRDGAVKVGDRTVKTSYSIRKGDIITLEIPIVVEEHLKPEDIPLDIIYEDEYLMLINKPPDMVVHPAPGHMSGTLVNALIFHCKKLSRLGGYYKAGIVHRLDRDTSGIMLVIKSDIVHEDIARQFERRTVHKEYLALVERDVELDSDLIELPIGRHKKDRLKMSIRHDEEGKEATSVYEVLERFEVAGPLPSFTLVKVMPRTGRTHQIRVHMKAIGHPIVADADYNSRDCLYAWEITGEQPRPDEPPILERQALHAYRLEFFHPILKKRVFFQAELPEDMQRVLRLLRERKKRSKQ
ncbi:MAG TPA: RluA family pseudouridine synthase [Candidatus Hypogeohydataceae bacterium YC41]